jgi:hypothetical protein
LSSDVPQDIDVLVLYDPSCCAPDKAYVIHKAEIEYIGLQVGLKPHAVLLTYDEEREIGFIEREAGAKVVESFAWH